MSDRLYVDPVTHSAREERALFALIKKLDLSVGQFTRMGVISYCRSLAEGGYLREDIIDDFNKVMQRDPDYLEKLKEERIKSSLCQTELLTQEKKPEEPLIRVWDKGSLKYVEIPESQFNPMFHQRA